ncbi:hypothetical protein FF38_13850 [Lucilia cuprina]|uniref:Uncharacterized protein n=1 Tax=Lucilia cuprina TaxID=7375 RepID=A0A0L0C484_LUCCU|nr:hypothetical protein CVS40_12767 [Lucilia cuprina]KNC27168.1 hypothetical protein FF38_13850 [Lucilia cuprina]
MSDKKIASRSNRLAEDKISSSDEELVKKPKKLLDSSDIPMEPGHRRRRGGRRRSRSRSRRRRSRSRRR